MAGRFSKTLPFVIGVIALGCQAQPPLPTQPTPDIDKTITAHVGATLSAIPTGTPYVVTHQATVVVTAPPQKPVVITPGPTDTPVALDGNGLSNTATFVLHGGDYAIEWHIQANGASKQPCETNGVLMSADQPSWLGETVMLNVYVDPGQSTQGETHTYNRPPGRYYLRISSECAWHVTVLPMS